MASPSMLKMNKLDPTFMGSRATPWNIYYRKCMLEHHTSHRATLKMILSGITVPMRTSCSWMQLPPQGSFTCCKHCSAVLNFSRKSLHTAIHEDYSDRRLIWGPVSWFSKWHQQGSISHCCSHQGTQGLEWRLRREEETSQCQFPAARAVLPRADVLQSAFATYLQLAVFIHSQVTWLQVLQQTGAEKLDVSSCNPSTQLSVESLLVFDVVP